MQRLAFDVYDEPNAGQCAEPVIDGQRVSAIAGVEMVGMWPQGLATAMLPAPGERRRVQLGRCACGDAGCDYLMAEVASTADEIIWTDFSAQSRKATPPSELRFERAAYIAALDTLPAQAAEVAEFQPQFVPPGPPQHFLMVARPGSTPQAVIYTGFHADDLAHAQRLARAEAKEQGVADGDYLVMEVAKDLDAATVEALKQRPPRP